MMASDNHSFVLSIVGQPPTKLGDHSSARKKWPTLKQILDQKGPFVPLWNKILLILCVIAVSVDPLFFYIPIIDEKNKCLGMDTKLRAAALTLRTLTDFTFLVPILCQIREAIRFASSKVQSSTGITSDWKSKAKAMAGKLSWRFLSTDILAILPIPQVLLVHFFFEMEGSRYLENRALLNVFLLAQYLPRIYRIHLSSKNLAMIGKRAKCVFNVLLYVLASHVLGAFWHYFSIHQETSCWHRACEKHGCMSNFYCHDIHNTTYAPASRNITLLDEKCPINVPANETAPFDFGIFLDSLKSGNTVSKDFPEKLSYCFWWGLRNLSNFGTNLQTSSYVWENCFAILICVIGLLLFFYLLGNVQTLIQMTTTKSEEIREKIKRKEQHIETWMDRNGLPEDMKNEVRKNIQQKLEENKDADLEDLFSILPWYTKKSLKRFLCMGTLRKVPMLHKMDEKVLKMICDYLKQVKYAENSIVVRMGDPLDHMLFITEGDILTYTSTDGNARSRAKTSGSPSSTKLHQKGAFYGEELLAWASPNNSFDQLPFSTQNVKCHTKVEGFVLMARDLRSAVSKCEFWWNLYKNNTSESLITWEGDNSTGIRYLKPATHRPH